MRFLFCFVVVAFFKISFTDIKSLKIRFSDVFFVTYYTGVNLYILHSFVIGFVNDHYKCQCRCMWVYVGACGCMWVCVFVDFLTCSDLRSFHNLPYAIFSVLLFSLL